ncbi:MAG: serine protease [Lachnospiraceae bacterium]|nr:serine protease [Lachnospiraceae bacterium]
MGEIFYHQRYQLKKKSLIQIIFITIAMIACIKVALSGAGTSSDSFENTVDSVRPAIVRVEGNDIYGSGIILSMEENKIWIATTMHFLEVCQEPLVTFWDGVEANGTMEYESNEYDLGIISVPIEEIGVEGTAAYLCAKMDPEAYARAETGDSMFLLGSAENPAEDFYTGTIENTWCTVPDFPEIMLLSNCEAVPGMSGCGTFDEDGNLIGMLVGGNQAGEAVSLPLIDLQEVLAQILTSS